MKNAFFSLTDYQGNFDIIQSLLIY